VSFACGKYVEFLCCWWATDDCFSLIFSRAGLKGKLQFKSFGKVFLDLFEKKKLIFCDILNWLPQIGQQILFFGSTINAILDFLEWAGKTTNFIFGFLGLSVSYNFLKQ
jgi:hypothetical protein